MSEIVVNVTDPGSYAVSVEGATPTTATVSNGGSVTVSMPGADVAWGDLVGLPTEFPPEDHVHDIADVTGLQAAIDGKADAGHGHAYPVTSVNGQTGDVVIEAGGGGADLSDATPEPLGTPDSGTSLLASRADHVHGLPSAAEIGAIDTDSAVDGGDYVGALLYTLTITANPQSEAVVRPIVGTWSYTLETIGQIAYSSTNGIKSLVSDGQTAIVVREGGVWHTADVGATWTQSARTFNSSLNARTMCSGYGNGRWIAVDSVNRISYTSSANPDDAQLWTETLENGFPAVPANFYESLYVAGGQRRISYGDGAYLASSASYYVTVSNGYGNPDTEFCKSELMASSDGILWAARQQHPLFSDGTALFGRVDAVTNNGNGLWVCCGCVLVTSSQAEFRVSASNDSVSWAAESLPGSITGSNVIKRAVAAFGNQRFVIIPNHLLGISLVRNENSATWSQHEGPGFEVLDLEFDGVFFVAVGVNQYATSADGETWTMREAPSGGWVCCCRVGSSVLALRDAAETLVVDRTTETGTAEAYFSVSAHSTSTPISYQWQLSIDSGATWADVSLATSSSLSLSGITIGDDGNQYRAIVSAPDTDSATSEAAILTVT